MRVPGIGAGVRWAASRRRVAGVTVGLAVATLTVALGITGSALRETRVEADWLRGQLAERRDRVRQQRAELQELAGRVERVARAASGAQERATQLRRVARLEESREPETSPLLVLASAGAPLPGWTPAAGLAFEQLAWLEGQTAAVNEAVALLTALLRDGRSTPVGGMPTRWPVRGEVTSAFGIREAVHGSGTDFHPGIDIRAPIGMPVLAAGAGQVVFAGAMRGYGRTLVIDHGEGVSTLYAHLSALHAADGQSVRRGEVIGAVGRSGRTTGPHLHYEVRIGAEPVDPRCHLSRPDEPVQTVSLTAGG